MTLIRAESDPTLAAFVVARSPLHYSDGADETLDRPRHVRAGSSLAWVPGGIALIQDDANFVAVLEPGGARVRAIALPAGKKGKRQFDAQRGNKKHRMDLEACVAVRSDNETLFVALGSGSSERRERVAILRWWESGEIETTIVHVPELYATLRRAEAFAGSELNVEGAVHLGDRLRLFGRGNGKPRDGVQPINATCDLDWPMFLAHLRAPERNPPPSPTSIVGYSLGMLEDVALSFTDAAVRGDDILFSASAEASPDVLRDGRVTGSAIGVISSAGRARWTQLSDPTGAPFVGKVEGLVVDDSATDRLFVVVDADDPDAASALCTVQLRGDWWGDG